MTPLLRNLLISCAVFTYWFATLSLGAAMWPVMQ
jgi:hypothetical protein